jgi:hypothetical protein
MSYYVLKEQTERPYRLIVNCDDMPDLCGMDWRPISNAEVIIAAKVDKTDVYTINSGKIKREKL